MGNALYAEFCVVCTRTHCTIHYAETVFNISELTKLEMDTCIAFCNKTLKISSQLHITINFFFIQLRVTEQV